VHLSSVHEFEARDLNGEIVDFSQYAGKALLIVNIPADAMPSDFTALENLYRKYRDSGFVVLGFPTSEFGFGKLPQESDVLATIKRIDVTFPVFSPIKVNGRQAHPLFVFLKANLPGYLGTKIQYDWTKFLVDRNGRPIRRIAPFSTASDRDVLKALET